jgi:hypothetical protein
MNAILKAAMSDYAVSGLNGVSYLMQAEHEAAYAVITIGKFAGKRFTNMGLVAHVENELIIIEHDINDKPLVDALVQAGIPREQIVLAYAGEVVRPTHPIG